MFINALLLSHSRQRQVKEFSSKDKIIFRFSIVWQILFLVGVKFLFFTFIIFQYYVPAKSSYTNQSKARAYRKHKTRK